MATPQLTHMQSKAYNQGVSHVLRAYDIIGNVVLPGDKAEKWQALQLLTLVLEELQQAMNDLAAVAPNHLAPVSRIIIATETGGRVMERESINLDDAVIIDAAQTLAEKYVAEMGVGRGAAISIRVTEILLITILHAESPMPELNIQSIRAVLQRLTESVREHERCAKTINRKHAKKERVH